MLSARLHAIKYVVIVLSIYANRATRHAYSYLSSPSNRKNVIVLGNNRGEIFCAVNDYKFNLETSNSPATKTGYLSAQRVNPVPIDFLRFNKFYCWIGINSQHRING